MSFATLINNTTTNNLTSTDISTMMAPFNKIKVARVTYVLLTEGDTKEEKEKFKIYGEWNGLGTIEYVEVTVVDTDTGTPRLSGAARPLFPNIKTPPTLNELVYIITTTVPDIDSGDLLTLDYYISSVNLWNYPGLNAWPGFKTTIQGFDNNIPGGLNLRRPKKDLDTLKLGNSFKEKSDIHPLKPFEGDSIYEGRWGNSIRFGSTNKVNSTEEPLNIWSIGNSNSGDPITILRNGQTINNAPSWEPIVENINTDSSSIYLTTTQQINLIPASPLQTAYSTTYPPPASVGIFNKPQIILNSSRLILNSREDSILLLSNKSIGLSSRETINLSTFKETVISSPIIALGGTVEIQPVLKGDNTVELLEILLKELQSLTATLSTLTVPTTEGPVPILSVQETAKSVSKNINTLLNEKLPTLRSTITFTK
jgi:hypothetical protein